MDHWYYQIELPDGTFTNGRPQPTLALARDIFRRIDKVGQRCLDIGSQEFVAPVLFHRQGAAEVVAYDRLNNQQRRDIVRQAYQARFHHVSGVPLIGLKQHLRDHDLGTVFDYVNFCGVLYHMLDPLCGLGMARSFLRSGGIMLLETSVCLDPGYVARVNHKGELYPYSNYFQVSLEALDYWVRMLRMRILDVVFTGMYKGMIGRAALVCRAVEAPVADADDQWMGLGFIESDFLPYGLDFRELASNAPPVRYQPTGTGNVLHPGLDSVDLFTTYQRKGMTDVDPALCRLQLKDVA